MLTLLRKLFIKDYKNIENPKVRDKHGKLASIVGILSNIILSGFKITIGLLIGSIAIVADALNNISDMASSVVSLVGFHISGKPADKKHPFGHERFEYISSLIISIVMLALAVELLVTSVKNIFSHTETEYTLISFIILGGAILIKLWQGFFYMRCAKLIDSVTLKASGQDSFNDCISTGVILIGAIISYFAKVNLDAYLGVAVSLFILYSSLGLIRESISPLLGEPVEKELVDEITKSILSYQGTLGVHDIICHSYGPTKKFMSVHVEVDGSTGIIEAHELIDLIEEEVSQKYSLYLTIHMDPIDKSIEGYEDVKKQVSNILMGISQELSFHDFRMVRGGNHVNTIFDVVVPFEFKMKDAEIEEQIKKQTPKGYVFVINFDRKFTE